MYAIIVTGGKQYKVAEGDTIYVEKLEANDGDAVQFDNVLVVEKDGAVAVGAPKVEGASVSGKVVKNGKGKKIMVFKYKAKKNYRRRQTALHQGYHRKNPCVTCALFCHYYNRRCDIWLIKKASAPQRTAAIPNPSAWASSGRTGSMCWPAIFWSASAAQKSIPA